MKLKLGSVILFISFCLSAATSSILGWERPEQIGNLDFNLLNEASGIAVSQKFPGRLYHINDSGGSASLFVSNKDGSDLKQIKLKNMDAIDFEDMAYGPCGTGHCIYIGDIGGNVVKRDAVNIVVVKEKENFLDEETPLLNLRIRYPDGNHDAEGLAIDSNGDLYLATKDRDEKRKIAYPVRFYRYPQKKVFENSKVQGAWEYVGQVDLKKYFPETNFGGHLVTSMDIAKDGKSFLLLTYVNAIEFNFPIRMVDQIKSIEQQTSHKIIELNVLPQQEAVTYDIGDKKIIYTTEYHKDFSEVPIMESQYLE